MAKSKEETVSKKMLAAEQSDQEKRAHPFLLIVVGFTAAIVLLGCCVCGIGSWWFWPEVHEDPIRAEQLAAEIVDIQIPESYLPKGTIELNGMFLMSLRGVYYERFVGDGLLVLIEVESSLQSDADIRRHIRQTLMEKGGGGTPLVVDDSETRRFEIEVKSQLVPFSIEIGRDPATRRAFYVVEGVFPGKSGDVLLAMRVAEDNWDEASVIAMLQSIGRPAAEASP